jgi:hypothetical protein
MAVKAVWTIRHNGDDYPPGSLLTELDKEEEKRLVEKGLAIYEDHEEDDEQPSDNPVSDDEQESGEDSDDERQDKTETDKKKVTNRAKTSRGKGK